MRTPLYVASSCAGHTDGILSRSEFIVRPSYLCLLAVVCLPGCATIVDGTTQRVAIQTAPNGAACTVQRGGEYLGTITPTPGVLLVDRSRRDLTVVCNRPGWEPTVANIESKFTGVMLGNAIIGGWGGVIVDAATGAGHRYDDGKIILMTPPLPGRTPAGISLAPMAPVLPPAGLPPLAPAGTPVGTMSPRDGAFVVGQAGRS